MSKSPNPGRRRRWAKRADDVVSKAAHVRRRLDDELVMRGCVIHGRAEALLNIDGSCPDCLTEWAGRDE